MVCENVNETGCKNVVIISLDCVRQEALGCYPKRFPWRTRFLQEGNTHNLDRLCENGVRFDQAITHAPFTPPAHASILTGLNPPKHKLRNFLGAKLGDGVTTLAQILSSQGWQCGAIVGSHALSREYGLARGFHYYDDDIHTGVKNWHLGERRDAVEVTDRAIWWLKSLNQGQKFFLFVHYFDAHNLSANAIDTSKHNQRLSASSGLRAALRDHLPGSIVSIIAPIDHVLRFFYYKVKEIMGAGLDWILSIFEAGGKFRTEGRRFMLSQVSGIDAQIGRLIQELSDGEILNQTLIVILSDHGDDFMEHGEPTHRQFVYDSTLVVPLIIYPSLGDRSIVGEQVRLVDVFPTVLSILGVNREIDIDGRDLLELVNSSFGAQDAESRMAYSETVFELLGFNTDEVTIKSCYSSLRDYPWKLIWNRLDDAYELYRLDLDPQESVNRIVRNREIFESLRAELSNLAQDLPTSVPNAEKVIVDRLKSLGYL
jgi:arylsulfatase A-like enzyme